MKFISKLKRKRRRTTQQIKTHTEKEGWWMLNTKKKPTGIEYKSAGGLTFLKYLIA